MFTGGEEKSSFPTGYPEGRRSRGGYLVGPAWDTVLIQTWSMRPERCLLECAFPHTCRAHILQVGRLSLSQCTPYTCWFSEKHCAQRLEAREHGAQQKVRFCFSFHALVLQLGWDTCSKYSVPCSPHGDPNSKHSPLPESESLDGVPASILATWKMVLAETGSLEQQKESSGKGFGYLFWSLHLSCLAPGQCSVNDHINGKMGEGVSTLRPSMGCVAQKTD